MHFEETFEHILLEFALLVEVFRIIDQYFGIIYHFIELAELDIDAAKKFLFRKVFQVAVILLYDCLLGQVLVKLLAPLLGLLDQRLNFNRALFKLLFE